MVNSKFKNSDQSRHISTIMNFSKGMKYTNSPLSEGYAKVIANYDFKNDGECLVPRKSFKRIRNENSGVHVDETKDAVCVSTCYATVLEPDLLHEGEWKETNTRLMRYVLTGTNPLSDMGLVAMYAEDAASMDIDNAWDLPVFITTQCETSTKYPAGAMKLCWKPKYSAVHSTPIVSQSLASDAIHTSIDGNDYYLIDFVDVERGIPRNFLGKLRIYLYLNDPAHNNTPYIKYSFEEVSARDIRPTEAINYGYNMLSNTPYAFQNSVSATGKLSLEGIIPYDSAGSVALTSRVGESVTFDLVYQYPDNTPLVPDDPAARDDIAAEYIGYTTPAPLRTQGVYNSVTETVVLHHVQRFAFSDFSWTPVEHDGYTVYRAPMPAGRSGTSVPYSEGAYTYANTLDSSDCFRILGITMEVRDDSNLTVDDFLAANAGKYMWWERGLNVIPRSRDIDQYRVQWEVQDLDSGNDPVVVQRWTQSNHVTPGDKITLTYNPPYKRFSVICKVYIQRDIDAAQSEWDANTNLQSLTTRDEYPAPEQVTVLASYTLSTDADTKNALSPVAYPLLYASGMCTFQKRAAVWGLTTAPNMLFISDLGDVSYFPYPNNAEVFNTDIVACVEFKDSLLVFTIDSCYRLTAEEDGFKTKRILSNLSLSYADVNTVQVINNMIILMSGNRLYLMVSSYNQLGEEEFKLAPISRPIEGVFDDFHNFIEETLSRIYNTKFKDRMRDARTTKDSYNLAGCTWELSDFSVQLADTDVRLVYKVYLKDTFAQNNNGDRSSDSRPAETYMDVILIYNTVQRAWRMYTQYSTAFRSLVFVNLQNRPSVYYASTSYTPKRFTYSDYMMFNFYQYTDKPIVVREHRPIADDPAYTKTVEVVHDRYDDFINSKYELPQYIVTKNGTDIRHTPISYVSGNVPYLDTGNIDFNVDLVKRLREFRLTINKLDSTYFHDKVLKFYVDMYLDNEIINDKYTADAYTSDTDPWDGSKFQWYNETRRQLYYVRGEVQPDGTLDTHKDNKVSTPDSAEFPYTLGIDLDSTLSDVILLRCKEVGKCRTFNAIIKCPHPEAYELLSTGYVYRIKNAR